MPSNYPTGLDAFTTGTLTGIVSGSDHGNKADAINKIEAELGTNPSDTAATVAARLATLELGIYDANRYGIVADGSTDDTAAWNALIALVPDGGLITWAGNSKIQPGVNFLGRVALLGKGPLRSAFTISGGTTTNDGIMFGGADGLRYGHVLRDFSILGGASCCARALVLRNLVDPDVNVWVKAGATGHGASVEGVQNAKHLAITVTDNTAMGYAGTEPANGIRVVGSALIPTNANRFFFVTEGLAGDGIVGDGSVGTAGSHNNFLAGVTQGNGGKNCSLKSWTDFVVRDFHDEGSTGTELELNLCQRGQIGSGTFVDGLTSLIDCDDMKLDGLTTTALTIDSATARTECGRVFLNGGAYTNSSISTFWTGAPFTGETGDITPSIADAGVTTGGITVTGAAVGMRVAATYTQAVPAGVILVAQVSAADVVSYVFYNRSGGTWNATTGRVRAKVYRS